ncbi:MAG: hypothetical protein VYE44_04155 [Verrucomicrobiota bacterium]|nr:hypothetical protein [Verrucomicrobiota bacterium]
MKNRQSTVRSIHAWQIKLVAIENTHIYVDQANGIVATRLNNAWR